MSTYYGLRKSIKADELFDGRLGVFGVYEEVRPEGAADRFPPYMKVKEVRYLTDGRNNMEVVVYENGVAALTVRNLWNAPEAKIFYAIAEAFDTGLISEYEAQEEWDAHEMAKMDRHECYEDVLKYLGGEPQDLKPGTMIMAKIAKEITEKNPALLLPTNKHRLLSEIDTIYGREHKVTITLSPEEMAAAILSVTHEDEVPRA
jgi:hypothetical protein